ncbi:hypothetical protein JZ751_010814, partial [Albula glossodonta]
MANTVQAPHDLISNLVGAQHSTSSLYYSTLLPSGPESRVQLCDHYSTLLPSGPGSRVQHSAPHCCPQVQSPALCSTLLPSGPETSTLTATPHCCPQVQSPALCPLLHIAALRSRVQLCDHYSTLLPSGERACLSTLSEFDGGDHRGEQAQRVEVLNWLLI